MRETQDKRAAPIVLKQIGGGLAACDRRDELAKQLVVGAQTESREVIVEDFLAASGALTQNSPRGL
jgi:hypothetical protein